jgi:hypothetical protein
LALSGPDRSHQLSEKVVRAGDGVKRMAVVEEERTEGRAREKNAALSAKPASRGRRALGGSHSGRCTNLSNVFSRRTTIQLHNSQHPTYHDCCYYHNDSPSLLIIRLPSSFPIVFVSSCTGRRTPRTSTYIGHWPTCPSDLLLVRSFTPPSLSSAVTILICCIPSSNHQWITERIFGPAAPSMLLFPACMSQ